MVKPTTAKNLENTVYMELKNGRVEIKLRPDLAPKHVSRIKELIRQSIISSLLI